MDKIEYLVFEGRPAVRATKDKPIICFEKNGEMASVDWFRYGNIEFNGKYVTEIGYYKDNEIKKDKEEK